MQDSFSTLIDSASSIIIILPKNPYFDQVAAGLGLYLSLRDKKETAIFCPTPMIVEFNRLVGVNKITSELGNKNLIVRFTDYNPRDVERVSADIENNQFYLTVIPKPQVSAPKKEQVEFSYSGVSADTVILVSGKTMEHFPSVLSKDLEGAKLIHIGTRDLQSGSKDIISLAKPCSSVSEVVAALIKEAESPIDADIATNLLMGIEQGSKNFTQGDVTHETFEIFAYLMKIGGRRLPQEKDFQKFAPSPLVPRGLELVEKEKPKEPPRDWLEPKIYKGTSIS